MKFGATWCGPCVALAPELEALAQQYKGKVIFASVDVDECNGAAGDAGISGIPDTRLYLNGQ